MFNFFKKKTLLEDPFGTAQVLIAEFILKDDLQSLTKIEITESKSFAFMNKVRIYRLSLVLMVLISEERKHPAFIKVRKNVEKLFFGEHSEEGIKKLDHVKLAMKDLNNLAIQQRTTRAFLGNELVEGYRNRRIKSGNAGSLFIGLDGQLCSSLQNR